MSPRVSVIVPNYNGQKHLEECLGGVLAQDLPEPFEVHLVDNGSADDSVSFVRGRFPRVRIIENGRNLGFAAACNQAARAATGEYLVLLNNDVRVPPDWLRELVTAADEAPGTVLAVGSLIRLYHHPERVNHAGAKFAPIGGGFDIGLGAPLEELRIPAQPFATAAASGAGVLYRRRIFEALGGFDDRFFMYFEDAELGLRAWLRGHPSLIAPRSVVYHKFGATAGGADTPLKVYWGQRNRIRMAVRNFSSRALLKAIPLIALYTIMKTVTLAAQNAGASLDLWRATAHAVRDVRTYRRARDAHPREGAEADLVGRSFFATIPELVREWSRIRQLRRAGVGI